MATFTEALVFLDKEIEKDSSNELYNQIKLWILEYSALKDELDFKESQGYKFCKVDDLIYDVENNIAPKINFRYDNNNKKLESNGLFVPIDKVIECIKKNSF